MTKLFISAVLGVPFMVLSIAGLSYLVSLIFAGPVLVPILWAADKDIGLLWTLFIYNGIGISGLGVIALVDDHNFNIDVALWSGILQICAVMLLFSSLRWV